jgi:glycine cleavage system transcriptional repressor
MQQRFIMTAFGHDRPGIVADVTQILYENGCNLEDTSMTLLAGEFTLILLFSAGAADVADSLSKACRRLEQESGISAFFRPIAPEAATADAPAGRTRTLHAQGLDQAGIVYKISRFLADHQINIVDLRSTVKASPESGAALYVMDIQVHLPAGIASDDLEAGLSAVADDIQVDIAWSDG